MLIIPGCCEEESPALPDLVSSIGLRSENSEQTGDSFEFEHIITNVAEILNGSCGELETLTADESKASITIEYSSGIDHPVFQLINEFIYEVPAIPAGMSNTETFSINFDDPGIYRIKVFADVLDEVIERDEIPVSSSSENNIAVINANAKTIQIAPPSQTEHKKVSKINHPILSISITHINQKNSASGR
ncbi:MAG: hypothetical protein AAF487_15100 [Bacteroidota bacterium]